MKNAMQLKAVMKNIAKEKHISAQLVMQNFMLERLLEYLDYDKTTNEERKTTDFTAIVKIVVGESLQSRNFQRLSL